MRVQDKSKEINHKIQSHETDPEMVIDLLGFVPYSFEDVLLDAGSGSSKVWFKNFKCRAKFQYEINDGLDFLKCEQNVDWVIGNPPYHIGWDFTEHAFKIANKGVAWLLNINGLNSNLSPNRLEKAKEMGFFVTAIHIIEDRRWFGRYFFIIYQKGEHASSLLTWNNKKYGGI